MKKIVNFLLILILILFSPLENKVDAINQQEKKKFIVILNPNYKVKDIIGLDVIGNGSGKIKRKQIIRPLKNKTNLKRKLNKLEKKQKQITNEIQKRKIKKRINRLKRKVKNFNKLKATGKLDYKNRTFIIKFDNSIPDNFIINSLKSHPAINAIAKDYKIKSTALPNDPYVNNGSGDWTMEPNKQSIAIRTSNTDENGYDFYRSDLEKMWYLKTIQMDEVWKKSNTINGNGVVVAVIDSGQNMTHEDGQNIWINTDEYGNGKESNGIDDDPFSTDISNNPDNFVTTYVDDYQGWDYVDKDNIPNDDNGHGAHVSGTIAGSGNNGKGIIGIAPSANIMVLKTLAGNGSGSMSDIISALDYAINQGADIINMSLGSDKRESVDLTSDAINIIQNNLFSEAKAQGIVICIAAGNNRASHSSTGYSSPGEIYNNDLTKAYSPAWFAVNHSNLITVAATTWGNTEAEKQVNGSWQPNSLNESLANFSNFSSRKANAITVGAPGVHMYSLSHTSNSGYVIQQGTSMASPVVAGLAALIMGINDKLSPEEVVSIIKNNTDKTTGTDLNNSHYVGAGRINALKAVNAALESNIKITSPTNNPTINSPNITISGTAQASTALQLFINQSPVGNTFNSSADGNFTTSATFTSDGVKSIFITGEINGNNMTSNTISVTLDIFRPKIITPTSNITITSPTFNITGTTSPNTVVKIYKKQLNTNQFISSENVTNNGTYSINIQPHFSDFSKTVVYFASANVKVGSNITSKQSSPITLNFNIKDYPPEINFPSNNTIIYSPTFNIKGKAKAGESIQLVIDGVLSEKTTANGTLLNGFQDFTFEKTNSGQKTFLNSPQSILPIQKSYKVSSNVYQQPRESNSILLTFDVYKPIISQPENGITISTPTFNIIGKTEPNAKVSILKNGQTLITTTANASGTYNATIRYEFDGNTLTYTSSANVTISGSQTIKTDIKTYSFNVPDTRPLISSPTNLETIQSKKFTLRGTTSGNTLVTLYANGNPTSIQSYSDPSGNFTIPVTSSASGSSSFKVKANIYNKDYFSNQIQINFNVNTNAPTIEYPTEGTIIQSEKLSLRGTSKANTKVFIFESAPSSNSSILIGSTTSNGLGQWSFTLPIKTTKSTYFHVRTEEVAGEISSGLPSNELKLNLQRSPFASFIETPKNFETIQTKHLQISGTGTKNAVVKILKASNTNPVFQVIETTTTNENGKWSKIITSPTNDNYLLAAIVSTNNYKSTSNIISIQTNYAFSQKALSIDQPKTNSTTHKKRIKVQGKAPNGILNIHLDDQFNKAITVTQNLWNTFIELPNESTFKVQASSSHNTLIKFSNIIKITRNSKPKITETSEKLIKNKTFKLKGTGKEGIILTITIKENSFNYLTGINPMAGAQEKVVGQVLTDIDGNWEIEIPIQSSGTYIFKVYESYNNVAEVTSETYTYDLAMASNEVNLNIAPNPFNPTKSSLKIQYELPEPLNVDIKIYTLTGEIVYSKSFISNEIGGTSGRHIIEWNGQYDNGFIFPGLYVVLLQTSGNQNELKTKRLGVKW